MNLYDLIRPLNLANAAIGGFAFAQGRWVIVGLCSLSIALDLAGWVLNFKKDLKESTRQ